MLLCSDIDGEQFTVVPMILCHILKWNNVKRKVYSLNYTAISFILFSVANIHTEVEILGPQGAPT